MKPVLIVTCKPGNEEWCENEIGNVLFPLDPDIRIEKTKYSALLIVYSKIDPVKAYRHVKNYEYGFVANIVPVYYIARSFEELLSLIPRLVEGLSRVKVRLKVRGTRGRSKEYWARIKKVLGEKGVIHDPASDKCLFIEVIDELFYTGIGDCSLA